MRLDDLAVGELVAFNMLAGRVAQPVMRLAQLWQDFHQARLSVERLGDIFNMPPEPMATASRSAPPSAVIGAIEFQQVDFRYRLDGPLVLQDINLEGYEIIYKRLIFRAAEFTALEEHDVYLRGTCKLTGREVVA